MDPVFTDHDAEMAYSIIDAHSSCDNLDANRSKSRLRRRNACSESGMKGIGVLPEAYALSMDAIWEDSCIIIGTVK